MALLVWVSLDLNAQVGGTGGCDIPWPTGGGQSGNVPTCPGGMAPGSGGAGGAGGAGGDGGSNGTPCPNASVSSWFGEVCGAYNGEVQQQLTTISQDRHNDPCDTICNGEASVSVTGGTQPYSFLWNTGSTDSIIVGLCAGIYSCTVTDFVGDTATNTITIIDSNRVNTGTVAGPAAVYSGDTATYTVNNNTGSYYTWSASGGTIISGISAYQVTVVWGPAGMGTISTYEVDSNFCVGDIVSLNVVIGSTSSLEEEQEQHQIVVIYPNPFTESTVIEFENIAGASFELRVLDLSGNLIRERSAINGTRFVFRRDGMANGIYFLELRSKDQVFLGKLVLE